MTLNAARLLRLGLTHFRSYPAAALAFPAGPGAPPPVVLTGPNGAGKTNVLEAISLLSPGRGLRRAALGDFAHLETAHPEAGHAAAGEAGPGGWAVSALVAGGQGEARLGTGHDPGADARPRRCRIDGAPAGSATPFLDHVKILWLTPEMDGLFTGPPAERRRYLDRLVLAVDGAHGTRVGALERALRARNRLLEDNGAPRFLDAVERELSELAVAGAAARLETVERLGAESAAHARPGAHFPTARLGLEGAVERLLAELPAVAVEDRYRATLRDNRGRDRAAGRTLEGPHLSDLAVRHAGKDLAAARCSTGEQKALLIGLTLSHARLVAGMQGLAPILLLDDVVAYLDSTRRAGLFAALADLGAQVFMTGAEPSAFADLEAATRFTVHPGAVEAEAGTGNTSA